MIKPRTTTCLCTIFILLNLAGVSVSQTPTTWHDRADQAIESFLLKFWNGGAQYLNQNYPNNGSVTSYWTYANAWNAVMDGVERTGGTEYSGWIETLYLGQSARGWMSDYYDDECWMAIALIRAYDLTGLSKYLQRAEILYADIQNGWDTDCCGNIRGGVWWDKAHTQKATAANAGAALTGALLYQRTGHTPYLEFAEMVYEFWFEQMVNPFTFQVTDHFLPPDGEKVFWRFTYNEGLMIGAALELETATGNPDYLEQALHIARFMLTKETIQTSFGTVLFDGGNSECGGDCHQFKGPAYRYLAQLFSRDPSRTDVLGVLQGSAEAIWNLARDEEETLFAVNWAGPPQGNVDLLQQNAACTALSLYADLISAFPGSARPANQFEAENASLYKVGIESAYGDFNGWGYIAGWRGSGQYVKFRVVCTTPGLRTLTFRYAAGAGSASRLLRVNQSNLASDLDFPSTGGWDRYRSLDVSANLLAGVNTITLRYDSASGSSNWLNLDSLTVSDLGPPIEIRITNISLQPGGGALLSWNSLEGVTYQLQYKDHPSDPDWKPVGPWIEADGPMSTAEDPTGLQSQRYYRVITHSR